MLIISLYLTVSFVGINILKNGKFSSYLYGTLSLTLSKNLSNVAFDTLTHTSYILKSLKLTFNKLNLILISLLKAFLLLSSKFAPIDQIIAKASK